MNFYDEHGNMHTGHPDEAVEMGCETIKLDKLYGPLVFMSIRITASFENCEWIIERLYGENDWRVEARIPGQTDDDFPDDDEEQP